MKLKNKPIIIAEKSYELLRSIPEARLLNCAGVFILELDDKYVLLKNRWASFTDRYSVCRCGDNGKVISVKLTDLDYDYYKRENCTYGETPCKAAGNILFDVSDSQ